MDDPRTPDEAGSLPLQGPHWHRSGSLEPAADFIPMRLVLQPGGLSVELTRPEMLVGRHSQADICLRLPDVSRRHCRFVCTDNQWHVFDLQSMNGLFVNGEQVEEATLRHRDLVRIGSYLFEVDLHPGLQTLQLPAKPSTSEEQVLQSIAEALPPPATAGEDKMAS